jgi:nucleoside permease NupC
MDLKKMIEKRDLEVIRIKDRLIDSLYFLAFSSEFVHNAEFNFSFQLVFVNPVGEVMEKLQRANKLHNFFGTDSLFLTINEAVISLSSFVKLYP